MPRQARRYGSWDTQGRRWCAIWDDNVIGEPDGKTGGDDGVGWIGSSASNGTGGEDILS